MFATKEVGSALSSGTLNVEEHPTNQHVTSTDSRTSRTWQRATSLVTHRCTTPLGMQSTVLYALHSLTDDMQERTQGRLRVSCAGPHVGP